MGTTVYSYDAEGYRIAVDISGNGYDDVINPQAALSQVLVRTTAGNQTTYYVYGLGLIGEQNQNGYRVYHPDFRGSTVMLTDAGGSVTDRYMYDAYGNLMNHSGSSDTPFLYNGQYGIMTDGNGLIYMRARYYNPEVRRFVSQDSIEGDIGNPLSLNLFSYVENNPINNVDPSGNVPMYSLYYKTYQHESYDSLLSTYTSLQNRIKNETIILQGGSSFTDTLRAQLNLEDATGRYQIVNELLIIKGYNYSQEDKERANQTILDLEQQESDQMNEIAMGVVGGGGFGKAGVPIIKQLTGKGQLRNLRNNPNLRGVNIEELIQKTPEEVVQMAKDGKITQKTLKQIKKAFEGRDLGK